MQGPGSGIESNALSLMRSVLSQALQDPNFLESEPVIYDRCSVKVSGSEPASLHGNNHRLDDVLAVHLAPGAIKEEAHCTRRKP